MKYLKQPELTEWVETRYMPSPYQITINHPDEVKYLEDCTVKVVPNPYHWSNLNLGFITIEVTPLKEASRVDPLVELHQGVSEEISSIAHSLHKDNARIHFIVSNFFAYYFACDWASFTVQEYYEMLVDVMTYVQESKLPKWDKSPEYQNMLDKFKESFKVDELPESDRL